MAGTPGRIVASVAGLGRVGTALLAIGLAAGGVVLVTDGVGSPGEVSVVPALVTTCAAAGPYIAPERGSVGVPAGQGLCSSGPLTITTPGTVLDGWDLRGGVVVDAVDVVVRRSRITGDGTRPFGVVTTVSGSVRIEDTTLTGRFDEAAIGGAHWTAERVEVVGVTGDGARAGAGSRLRASVLSGFEPGHEVDGLELLAPDVVVEHTTVRMNERHRSAVRIDPEGGPRGPIVLRGNVLGGGEYTVHQPDAAAAAVRILDNRFAHDAARAPLRIAPSTESSGNVFVDGAPLAAF